ncbi:hypothetical protein [Stutzerimonas nitrititolerans]|uniref:hypothetical protein n=1 Tax=Stutzerimonas nitrititolerans TaxID=2482751 RepID=UPI00289BB5DC|nr:hypothetical protein [Stutzerimonas nitrititolerans]
MSTDPRSIRIDSLGLGARMVNALAQNGCHTLGDAARLGVRGLLGPGVGPETCRQLRHVLERHGIEHDIPRRFRKDYDY